MVMFSVKEGSLFSDGEPFVIRGVSFFFGTPPNEFGYRGDGYGNMKLQIPIREDAAWAIMEVLASLGANTVRLWPRKVGGAWEPPYGANIMRDAATDLGVYTILECPPRWWWHGSESPGICREYVRRYHIPDVLAVSLGNECVEVAPGLMLRTPYDTLLAANAAVRDELGSGVLITYSDNAIAVSGFPPALAGVTRAVGVHLRPVDFVDIIGFNAYGAFHALSWAKNNRCMLEYLRRNHTGIGRVKAEAFGIGVGMLCKISKLTRLDESIRGGFHSQLCAGLAFARRLGKPCYVSEGGAGHDDVVEALCMPGEFNPEWTTDLKSEVAKLKHARQVEEYVTATASSGVGGFIYWCTSYLFDPHIGELVNEPLARVLKASFKIIRRRK